jgi:hypothetical protein
LTLLAGGVAGITFFSASVYSYFRLYPSEAERLFVAKAVREFAKALDFDRKKLIYYTIPEFDLPVEAPIDAISSARGRDGKCSEADLIRLWARTVIQMHTQLESSWIVTSKEEMRHELISEAKVRLVYCGTYIADRWAWRVFCDRPCPISDRGSQRCARSCRPRSSAIC